MERPTDEFTRKLLRKPKAEAASWLDGATPAAQRVLGEMTHSAAVKFVRRIYAAGALDVVAVDIKPWQSGDCSSAVLIELPDDPTARERLFELQRKTVERQGFDGTADEGQSHLFCKLD